MKKIFCFLVFVLSFLISFVSCGDDEGGKNPNPFPGTEWVSSDVKDWSMVYKNDVKAHITFSETTALVYLDGTLITGTHSTKELGRCSYSVSGSTLTIKSYFENGRDLVYEFTGSYMKRSDGDSFLRTFNKK